MNSIKEAGMTDNSEDGEREELGVTVSVSAHAMQQITIHPPRS